MLHKHLCYTLGAMPTTLGRLVASVTLSATLFAPIMPVFAQTVNDADLEKELIQACFDEGDDAYRADIEFALKRYRDEVIQEWGQQTRVRLEANASSTRFAVVRRGIGRMGQILDRELKVLGTTRVSASPQDLKLALDAFVKLEGQKEDAAIERWEDRNLSLESIKATLRRAEQTLRLYTPVAERAEFSRVWRVRMDAINTTLMNAWEKAREGFTHDMDECILGEEIPEDEDKEGLVGPSDMPPVSTDKKDDAVTPRTNLTPAEEARILLEKQAQNEAARLVHEAWMREEAARAAAKVEAPSASVEMKASVLASADGRQEFKGCSEPEYMVVNAIISTNAAGIVKYAWDYSGMYGGGMQDSYLVQGEIQYLEFASAGSKTVTWKVPFVAHSSLYNMGARVRIIGPNQLVSSYVEGVHTGVCPVAPVIATK